MAIYATKPMKANSPERATDNIPIAIYFRLSRKNNINKAGTAKLINKLTKRLELTMKYFKRIVSTTPDKTRLQKKPIQKSTIFIFLSL